MLIFWDLKWRIIPEKAFQTTWKTVHTSTQNNISEDKNLKEVSHYYLDSLALLTEFICWEVFEEQIVSQVVGHGDLVV